MFNGPVELGLLVCGCMIALEVCGEYRAALLVRF